jgi:hypothetical protein
MVNPLQSPKEIHRMKPEVHADMSVEQKVEISDTSDNHKWIDGRRFHNADAPYELPNDLGE